MGITIDEKLDLLKELLSCSHDLYFWSYDKEFHLISSNCIYQDLLDSVAQFSGSAIPKYLNAPALFNSPLGLSWSLCYLERGPKTKACYYMIGPVISSASARKSIQEAIQTHRNMSIATLSTIDDMISHIPSMPLNQLMECGLMLFYCLTGRKLSFGDYIYLETDLDKPKEREDYTPNPQGTWLMEEKLLKLIEDGNMNYDAESSHFLGDAIPADLGNGFITRHYKNLIIAFTALCTRAAIKGGLSPETAYPLSDTYILKIEQCVSISELLEINSNLVQDFIIGVNRAKNSALSQSIKRCIDYIQIHIEEELSLEILSSQVGYSATWLSAKFKEEMGETLSFFITKEKIHHAKHLIRSGKYSMSEIADRLHYSSPSHFGAVFKKITGITPVAYREQANSSDEPSKTKPFLRL